MLTELQFTYDAQTLLRKELFDLKLSRRSTVLNLACEDVLVPPALAPLVDPNNVYGVEINQDIVARMSHIKYADVDRDRFPFDDASFDLVLSVWGMEHFRDQNVFNETERVLKSGGQFIFMAPHLGHPIFWISKFFGAFLSGWYYRHILHSTYQPHAAFYRFNRQRDIEAAARRSGLQISKIIYFGPANLLGYFAFSSTLKRIVAWFDQKITNARLAGLKPYLLVVMEKE